MPTVAVTNLGCKVNQYEIERIAESFKSAGFDVVDFRAEADVYVINSCSVTADADKKSRHMARRAARTNPAGKVVVTGCFAQRAIDLNESVEGAALLIPNDDKMRTLSHVLKTFPELITYSSSIASAANSDSYGVAGLFPESQPGSLITTIPVLSNNFNKAQRTRATLKIQDGCEYFCAFCSIPFTRNVMASRPFDAVISEAKLLRDHGAKEIVVTGVCVGAYGADTGSGGAKLADILVKIADIPGIERVRLSSVQPVEVPDSVINAIATHPNIAAHLHLSAQSGDDTILRLMNRPYDSKFFSDMVQKLRCSIPNIGLTTDLIVGFPGETEALFQNTLLFASEMQFARTHVFRYSPRERTAAASEKDSVTFQQKEDRHSRLTKVCNDTQRAFAHSFVGTSQDVLVESKGSQPGQLSGYTSNYIRVNFDAPPGLRGSMVRVKIKNADATGDAIGEIEH